MIWSVATRQADDRSTPRPLVGSDRASTAIVTISLLVLAAGCTPRPRVLTFEERQPIDRRFVEYPAGFELERYAVNLSGANKIAFDAAGNLFVAEGGIDGSEPRIYAFAPAGKMFDVYPVGPSLFPFAGKRFRLYGPIGGMIAHDGKLFVSHRDADDFGVITALDYNGGHRTVVAGLPAQGEHGVTDLAIHPRSGRLYFGVGSATNSGVVGPDDFALGWARKHPAFHDIPYLPLVLRGQRFDSINPSAGLFTPGPETAVSAHGQPFGISNKTRLPGVAPSDPKFTGGIFSVAPEGGDLKVEAHGIRYPRGLAFNEYEQLYFTNNGMEARGTRPVLNDTDALLRLPAGGTPNFGWPDHSADLLPIAPDALRRADPEGNPNRFQPPGSMILRSGYPDVSFLIDHDASGLVVPNRREFVHGIFPSQSGAAGLALPPAEGPFAGFVGSALVALAGDRAPFATSGMKLRDPRPGHKIVRVDLTRRQVRDFIQNVQGPAAGGDEGSIYQLQRPIDVKFGPDGALYILDLGRMTVKGNGDVRVEGRTGQIFRLRPLKRGTAREADAARAE